MRSPLGDPVRSESVAGMDMLNDMFQRQARRLESQLYQRAQDQRTIEMTQRQAQLLRSQVRQLEQHHLEQAARISQGAKSLQRLQDLIRDGLRVNQEVLSVGEALERDAMELRETLERVAPGELAKLRMRCEGSSPIESLRAKAYQLESSLDETERTAQQQIGVTPLTSVAMSSDCNPLNDLSAVADYASKASVGSTPVREPAPSAACDVSIALPQAPPAAHNLDASMRAPMAMSPRFANAPPYSPHLSGIQPMALSRDPSFEQPRHR